MTRHRFDTTDPTDPTVVALRALDASDRALDDDQRARAAASLERILVAGADGPAPRLAPRPSRRTPRLALAGGLVAAATAVVVAVPLVTGGEEAFASWSPIPVELSGAERSAAVDACFALQADDGELAAAAGAEPTALVAEGRGGWSYVVYTAPAAAGFDLEGSCLMPDELVADPGSGDAGFFGSLGSAEETGGTPGPEAVREDSYGVGEVDGDGFAYAAGRAGADVVSIVVTTPGGTEVQASLEDGRWAVWWPGGEARGDNTELFGAPSYEVTLRDGSVRSSLSR